MTALFSKDIFINKLEDVISVGFCDDFNHENILEYTINTDIIYLDLGCFLLRLESVDQYSRLLVKRETKIEYNYTIDEDMKYAFSRLHNIIFKLGEMSDVYIRKILLYNLHTAQDDFIICDAIKVYLSSAQILFFDPANYFGINIGGEDLALMWEEQNKHCTVTTVGENGNELNVV